MTTAQPQMPPHTVEIADDLALGERFPGYFLIPLSEFGQSLDSPDLDEWFEAFAERNTDAGGEFEITAQGELKIMAPTGDPGDLHEYDFGLALGNWALEYGGRAGGPTSRFVLPDGSRLGPDAWWISQERWSSLPAAARRPFRAMVPDFVVEIVSPSNRGPELADKVRRYLDGGARLVWIIHATRREVIVHRPDQEPETLRDPETLGGGDVLPGFAFNVRERIFDNVP